MQNPVPPRIESGVAERIAQESLAERNAAYATEVRRLLDAGLEVMRGGTARVADIVAAAGLSNDAFYRHFPSKDAFVAALIEDGSVRLRSYLAHQMAKVDEPAKQVRRWVEGVLSQVADEDLAAQTYAVVWNGRAVPNTSADAGPARLLAELLEEPFAALGSTDRALDAALVSYAVVSRMSEHLWRQSRPGKVEIEHVVAFALRSVTPSS